MDLDRIHIASVDIKKNHAILFFHFHFLLPAIQGMTNCDVQNESLILYYPSLVKQ